MNLAELQRILRDADPAAVLVSPRILERVIREECRLPSLVWSLPHNKSFVCDRQVLFRHAEQADLELEPDQLLPDTVILLTRPDAEELSNLERPRVLLKYWRRLFHSRVHLAFGNRPEDGPLTDEGLRERMGEIGQTEFEEIRQVLVEDRFLPAEADARHTYVEFASVYLELRYFAPGLLRNYFPGITDPARTERLLGRDVDAPCLFAATRLHGAPDPSSVREVSTDESQEAYWTFVRSAQKAATDGNRVKAAILRTKAARIAPAALTGPTRQEAEADLADIADRLAKALQLDTRERDDWMRQMVLLLDKADQGVLPVEERLLNDLQRVCHDHERDVYMLDLIEFISSGGKRPIKRPLPSQKSVRVVRNLASAVSWLDEVRLSDTDRGRLSKLMEKALGTLRHNLDARFRPILTTALEDVGLKPANPVERVAFDKMVAELLDRIATYGFVTFGELRDTISRNQLKLPDLTEPEHFLRGDPLLRLDTRLASLLDGVYQRGEFYVRWLERGTSLLFGTLTGRVFTRFLLLPLVLAWMSVYLLGYVVSAVPESWSPPVHRLSSVMMGPVHDWAEEAKARNLGDETAEVPHHDPPHWGWHVGLVVATAVLALALLENERFRRRCLRALIAVGHGLKRLTWDVPMSLVPSETIQRALASWPFQLFYWAVLKPGVVVLVLAFAYPPLAVAPWYVIGAVYLSVALVVNSRFGKTSTEAFRDGVLNLASLVRSGLLPGLLRFVMQVFKRVVELIELTFFRIDEWLRFSTGDSTASLVARTVLGVIWYPIAIVVRFFMLVLIEPMINPLKLPMTFLAAKLYYALGPAFGLLPQVSPPSFSEYIGTVAAYALVFVMVNLLPSIGGFLGWEMKENWGLYRSNRGPRLGPLPVGAHGETVRGLLQPGFHSGTVPAVFARLRVAERNATRSRNWSRVRSYRHEVEHVAEALKRFVAREFIALLSQSKDWGGIPLEAGRVALATNRLSVSLVRGDFPRAVKLEVQHHHGRLTARVRDAGWLGELTDGQRRAFAACLAGFYKRCDVDLVREQLVTGLPGPLASLEFASDAIAVRTGLHAEPVRYRLDGDDPESRAALYGLVFGWSPVAWADWVDCWRRDENGEGNPGLGAVAVGLLPPPAPRPAPPPEANGDTRIQAPAHQDAT